MKQLKVIRWCAAGLSIMGIVWFLSTSRRVDDDSVGTKLDGAFAEKAVGPGNPSMGSAAANSRVKSQRLEETEVLKRYAEAKSQLDEARKRRDEAFKKVAKGSTPESRARMVDGVMERRDREYRQLFVDWGLDSNMIEEVLAIVRERELRILEDRKAYFEDSLSPKRTQAHRVNSSVEHALAEAQLTRLLGESRALELLAADKRMREEDYERAGITVRNGR